MTLEEIAFNNAPKDTIDEPAYPNHTDTDIYVAGFKSGIEYLNDLIISKGLLSEQIIDKIIKAL